MTTEQDKTIKALEYALQMEIDGKKFYLKARRKTRNELGKNLLKSLATEEDIHQKKFEEIYKALRNKKAWPKTVYHPDGGRGLRTIFARALETSAAAKTKAEAGELDAIQTAMTMENKSYDFYEDNARHATYESEREFYEALAAQEREHYLILTDYYEYLKEPAAWFVKKEHPSLNGG